MDIQDLIDKKYTSASLKQAIISYALTLENPADLLTVALSLGSRTVRAEFFVSVDAGCLLSVRRAYTNGREYEGPIYGYALSLGVPAQLLTGLIEKVRKMVKEDISLWEMQDQKSMS